MRFYLWVETLETFFLYPYYSTTSSSVTSLRFTQSSLAEEHKKIHSFSELKCYNHLLYKQDD